MRRAVPLQQLNFMSYYADIDECAMYDFWCPEHSTCSNTPGSYDCVCNDGYMASGSQCIGQLPSSVFTRAALEMRGY